MKRCFVGTWISPGIVLTPTGLELSLGREQGNGGSRCVAMAMQGAATIGTGLLSFRFSARTESPRQGLAVLGAPRPPTAWWHRSPQARQWDRGTAAPTARLWHRAPAAPPQHQVCH